MASAAKEFHYTKKNGWLYFIEAVTSVGPISVKRMEGINAMTVSYKAGKIFVTAFGSGHTALL